MRGWITDALDSSGIGVRRRINYAVVATLVVVAFFVTASHQPLSRSEAEELSRFAAEFIEGKLSPQGIFLNNMMVALLLMLPAVGVAVAGFVLYQTGLIIASMATLSNIPPIILVAVPFLTFYGIPEMLAYGSAVSESVILAFQIAKRRFRAELRVLPLVVLAVFLLLAVAALVEYLLLVWITQLAGGMGIETLV